jgi:hypothetical protein
MPLYMFIQFTECSGTDCKYNGITKINLVHTLTHISVSTCSVLKCLLTQTALRFYDEYRNVTIGPPVTRLNIDARHVTTQRRSCSKCSSISRINFRITGHKLAPLRIQYETFTTVIRESSCQSLITQQDEDIVCDTHTPH